MTRGLKLPLEPTPAELAAMVAAAWFLWYIADGIEGAIVGVVGVGAGMVLSRLAGIVGPRRLDLGRAVWALVILGFVLAAPFLASGGFRTTQMATAGYTAIAVLGLNLLTGYTGQASIGHSAFLGIGAYTAAIMVDRWDVSIGLAMVAGTLAAALAGFLVGVPALRLSGPYLAIATLALAVVFTPLLKLNELADWTGGHTGINLFDHQFGPPVDWGWLTNERWYYFIIMGILALGVLLAYNLVNSAVGRSFRAVRDNEVAAAAMGVNVPLTKLSAFAISAAYAGFAGGLLFILSNRFVAPESFTVLMSIELLLVMVIGGMASIPGSLIGAFFLVYVYREGLDTISSQTEEGSDAWLLMAGIVVAAAVLLGSGWISRQTRTYGARLNARYGEPALNVAKLVAAVAIGVGFTWLFRTATEELLDLVSLRGAIAGSLLIFIVLFVPGGFATLMRRIQILTWADIYAWLRDRVRLAPRRATLGLSEAGGAAGRSPGTGRERKE